MDDPYPWSYPQQMNDRISAVLSQSVADHDADGCTRRTLFASWQCRTCCSAGEGIRIAHAVQGADTSVKFCGMGGQ